MPGFVLPLPIDPGKTACGWGETPISVQWAWPAKLSYQQRYEAMTAFCEKLARLWCDSDVWGHPLEVGTTINESQLAELHGHFEHETSVHGKMPWLAALICSSAYDLALHDAYGVLHGLPVYQTYHEKWMNRDLASYFGSETRIDFTGKYPADFLTCEPNHTLPAWHLVGGLDPLDQAELDSQTPHDGYPVLLEDWIDRDGLDCLKIKLRGTDAEWDFERTVKVGKISLAKGVHHLSTDFNCTVHDPAYVTSILNRLKIEYPEIYDLLLYVEQPFPYELKEHPIDVGTIAEEKPIFMDESAHDWRLVREGHRLNWNGVALKTCKTQSGALLSLCWAKAHGMQLMVQDLTNPMLGTNSPRAAGGLCRYDYGRRDQRDAVSIRKRQRRRRKSTRASIGARAASSICRLSAALDSATREQPRPAHYPNRQSRSECRKLCQPATLCPQSLAVCQLPPITPVAARLGHQCLVDLYA